MKKGLYMYWGLYYNMEYCICMCPILDNTGTDASNICKVCHKKIPNYIYPTEITPINNDFNVTTFLITTPDEKCTHCKK